MVVGWTTFWYLVQRIKHGRSIEEDEVQRTTIKRWGDSVDNVRTQLSAGDQVRVRTAADAEMYHGVMLPVWYKQKPEGMPWPQAPSH